MNGSRNKPGRMQETDSGFVDLTRGLENPHAAYQVLTETTGTLSWRWQGRKHTGKTQVARLAAGQDYRARRAGIARSVRIGNGKSV